jgi:hypothetical protein
MMSLALRVLNFRQILAKKYKKNKKEINILIKINI